jgi:hypothetical protein
MHKAYRKGEGTLARPTMRASQLNGAGDGDRTRDIELGKLAFYR